MLSKEQKQKIIKKTAEAIEKSQNLVFADFSGINTEAIKKLKSELKKAGANFKVVKKTLFKLAFREAGFDFDPLQFKAQLGAIFMPKELSSAAGVIYKFSKDLAKEKKNFQILGNYDLERKIFMTADEFISIAKLPSREVLLAQVAGAISSPLRAFMHIISELAKKTPVQTQTAG